MGLNVLAALISQGVGFGSALVSVYGAVGAAALRIGASLLLSAASAALAARSSQADQTARKLALPSSLPSVRYVYGATRATGTPANFPVREDKAVGFWLLNSRISDLPTATIYLDGREITYTGDPFDFSGAGAASDADPFQSGRFRFWIGRGDQTAPPDDILADFPQGSGRDTELFDAADAMQGCTILWAVMTAGPSSSINERWVAMPPTLEVEGNWSRVYDPREAGHDPDDSTTWEWSRNHALVTLDVLRGNPMRPHLMRNILTGSFEEGADICDETVSLRSGGTEPRWCADGTVIFDGGEVEDILAPLMVSGAADLIRVGGQVGYAWGKYRAPTATVTEVLGEGLEITDLLPGDDLVNLLRVTYTSPGRGYQTAELRPWPIPGALAEDGGIERAGTLDLPFAGPTQAMRARKRLGLRMRRQMTISGASLPPECFDLVAGATVTLDPPALFEDLAGIYEIQSIDPFASPLGDSGAVALHLPVVLTLADPDEDDWTPATDEEDIVVEPYDGTRSPTVVALADLAEPAGLGRSRYVDGWRGGEVYTSGDGYWWRDTVSGEIVTNARYVAQFGQGDYQIDAAMKTFAQVISLTRASSGSYLDATGALLTAGTNVERIDYADGVGALLVEPAATNLLLHSEDFSNAAWVIIGAGTTVSANDAEAPSGAVTADTITSTSATPKGIYQAVAVTPSTQYTLSGWVRLGTLTAAEYNLSVYDVTAGAYITTTGTLDATLSPGEWVRGKHVFTTPAGCTSIMVYPWRKDGSAAGNLALWGWQLEVGASATSYIATTSAPVTRAADVTTIKGITATLDLSITCGDGTEATFATAAVAAGYWPAVTQTRIRRIVGRTP